MSEKTIIDLGAMILEAMSEENTLMPYDSSNGVSIDTRERIKENGITHVSGYWKAPDTGERYYIEAEVKITPTVFERDFEDEDW